MTPTEAHALLMDAHNEAHARIAEYRRLHTWCIREANGPEPSWSGPSRRFWSEMAEEYHIRTREVISLLRVIHPKRK